jgi:hypothetical protein
MVATTYQLPYDVLISRQRPFAAVNPLRIAVVGREALQPPERTDLAAIFTAFDILAQTGAMCGPVIPPGESGIDITERFDGDETEWHLTGCRVDERAFAILAHSFLLSRFRAKIARVEIGEGPYAPMPCAPDTVDPYPTVFTESRVALVRATGLSDSIRIILAMRRAMIDDELEALSNLLFNAATAIGMGLYGVAPIEPADCGLQFSDTLEEVGSDVIFSIDRFRAHPAAVDAFLNVCLAFDHELGIVRAIAVE